MSIASYVVFPETHSRLQECDRGQLHDWINLSRASDQDSRTFQCYPWLWASVHKGKSIVSSPNQKTGIHWCYSYLAGDLSQIHTEVVLSALVFSCSDSFERLPPYCVIEKPMPCHYTSTVLLSGRASATSSGPPLNTLRQALADCWETENPWLAENNKYPWEAARWTFTVSLAGEGEICQTSH